MQCAKGVHFSGFHYYYYYLPLDENISSYSLLPPLLPQTGDIVLIIITSVRTPRRVFAQLPLGPFAVSDDNGKHE